MWIPTSWLSRLQKIVFNWPWDYQCQPITHATLPDVQWSVTLERWPSERIVGSSPHNSKLSWTDIKHNYGALSNTKWYKLLMSKTFSNISTACTMAVSAPIVFDNLWMPIPISSNPAHHIDVIKQYIGRAFYSWKLINANVKDRNPAWNSSWWILLSSL